MKKPRRTKDQLLKKGLAILAERGIEGLTIEALCTSLHVTKGSFYHHFSSQAQFQAELLEFWMQENTERKKALADRQGSLSQRYAEIVEYAATLPHDLEKAIRAWAMRSPLAAEYQAKADASRKNYLASLLQELLEDKALAEPMATVILSVMVGLRHLYPPVMGRDRHNLMRILHSLLGVELPMEPPNLTGDSDAILE